MAREISRAENWERVYSAFAEVNFSAFDFNTIKESMLDYLKLYFPEDFNDYIESSELIAIVETFAYMGEQISYRLDMNAHENFITQAQRKDSILRLAKLISYNPTRNLPARGLVKLQSIQTSEAIVDSQGNTITNTQIRWNDQNNPIWKEQFTLVMNKVLGQRFGTVMPNERQQIDDVLFELYSLDNKQLNSNGISVFKYSADSDDSSVDMELVPVVLQSDGIEEKRPEKDMSFTLLYGSDGLGDGSDTTGFFMYTKQGTLQILDQEYDGITPNQVYNLEAENVNDIDVWLNNVDETGNIVTFDPFALTMPHLSSGDSRYGEWFSVDLTHSQNILFNTDSNRHKYEIETLDNDQIRVIYGDGEFSDIPKGLFQLWYRTSANRDLYISKNAVVNRTATFQYTDSLNKLQTLTFTFSLINSLQNGSASETLTHIKNVAPSVYYTQDRMVNGRDYNTYMLQDPSIAKMKAVNRTFAGDSKYIAWHDPREYYDNVKMFSDDGAMYWEESDEPDSGDSTSVPATTSVDTLITDYIEPILCNADMFAIIGTMYEVLGLHQTLRCKFKKTPYSFDPTSSEYEAIGDALDVVTEAITSLYYSAVYDEWTVGPHPCQSASSPFACENGAALSEELITVEKQWDSAPQQSNWVVSWNTRRLVMHSVTTKFWNMNDTSKTVDFDTLSSQYDNIVILRANPDNNNDKVLSHDYTYDVIAQEIIASPLPDAGLPDIHKVMILAEDANDDGVPDNITQPDIVNYDTGYVDQSELINTNNVVLPDARTYVKDHEDEDVLFFSAELLGTGEVDETTIVQYTFDGGDLEYPTPLGTTVTSDNFNILATIPVGRVVRLVLSDYVYLTRLITTDPWQPQFTSDDVKTSFYDNDIYNDELNQTTIRRRGRYPLNFAWFHYTPRHQLIDPSATNIIDSYIVTQGYYLNLNHWLAEKTELEPDTPTSLSLTNTYSKLLENKMISDTVIVHPGKFKILFGAKANTTLQATMQVIRGDSNTNLTDNEVKVRIVGAIRNYFNIAYWEFGETFYFSEMATMVHNALSSEIDSIVLVPNHANSQFGDLIQIQAREDELFAPDITTDDIKIVKSYTPDNIKQLT